MGPEFGRTSLKLLSALVVVIGLIFVAAGLALGLLYGDMGVMIGLIVGVAVIVMGAFMYDEL